jgi:hypothetical protein
MEGHGALAKCGKHLCKQHAERLSQGPTYRYYWRKGKLTSKYISKTAPDE